MLLLTNINIKLSFNLCLYLNEDTISENESNLSEIILTDCYCCFFWKFVLSKLKIDLGKPTHFIIKLLICYHIRWLLINRLYNRCMCQRQLSPGLLNVYDRLISLEMVIGCFHQTFRLTNNGSRYIIDKL